MVQDGSTEGIFAQQYTGGPCSPRAAKITDLLIVEFNGGTELRFTWTDTVDSDDYVMFEDTQVDGLFTTMVATSPDGVTGVNIPIPSGTRYYRMLGNNTVCGVGR